MPEEQKNFLTYFSFSDMSFEQREICEPFYYLAQSIDRRKGDPIEKQVALRKLLESRDAALRSIID